MNRITWCEWSNS